MKDDLINALFNLPDNDGKTPLDLLIVNLKHASRGDEYGLSEIEQRQLKSIPGRTGIGHLLSMR